jgi:hypothetical protein
MKVKYTIYFFVFVLALVASEYFFLVELTSQQRAIILLLTSLVAVGSIIAIFVCYRRLNNDI